jgi:hypothetical protein
MKFPNRLVYYYARFIMMLAGGAAMCAAFVLLLTMLFNIPPYIKTQDGGMMGYTEYSKGIPVSAKISAPETALFLDFHKDNDIDISARNSFDVSRISDTTRSLPGSVHTITIKHANTWNKAYANGLTISEMVFYINRDDIFRRFLYLFPRILQLLLIAWCTLQLSLVLQFVKKDQSFRKNNYKRLFRMGAAIVIVESLLFAWGYLINALTDIEKEFVASVDHLWSVELDMRLSSHFNFEWLIAGCVLIVLSKAFLKGDALQEDSDLMI